MAFGPMFPCCVKRFEESESESEESILSPENAFGLSKPGQIGAMDDSIKAESPVMSPRTIISIEGFDNLGASKNLLKISKLNSQTFSENSIVSKKS